MATRKPITSRPKTTKSPVKRSAPIASEPNRPFGGEGGWLICPVSSQLGLDLIAKRRRARSTFNILDENGSPIRADRADGAMDAFAAALSYVPPQGAIEALASALLIADDFDMALNGLDERVRHSAADALERRVAGLAAWIESTHEVDRREHGFAADEGEVARLIPHAAKELRALPEHDS